MCSLGMRLLLFALLIARYDCSLVYFPPYDGNNDHTTRENVTLQYLMITGDAMLSRAEIVWNTWGKTIQKDYFLILSDSSKNLSMPVVQVMNISASLPSERRYRLSQLKWLLGLKMMKSRDFDWLIFIDDDTFILHNSLRKLLSHYNSSEPLLIGKAGEPACHFVCGGAGMALSQKLVHLLNTNYSRQFESEYSAIIHSNSTYFHSDVIISHFIHKHQVGKIIHHEEFKNFPPDVGMKWYQSHNRTPSPVVSYHRLSPEQYSSFYSIYYPTSSDLE
jgi:hypothetical protein